MMTENSNLKSEEKPLKDLGKRAVVAIILIPVAFLAIYFFPDALFFISLQGIILLALFEFYSLSKKKGYNTVEIAGFLFSILFGLNFLFEFRYFSEFIFLFLFFLGSYSLFSLRSESLGNFIPSFSITFFSVFYLSFTLNYIYYLRKLGNPYLFILLFSVYIGDTAAYLFGKTLGKRKIFPLASPNKTVEGFIGAIPFYVLGGLLGNWIFLKYPDIFKLVISLLLLSFVSQLSDPVESLFKRAVGVKDSSKIFGEHGGFLDRLDALIFSSPFFYFLCKFYLK
ncbi:MAG: phosphatidate cytidylyltransferase [Candidatus Aminicenantia bacterium]